MTTTPSLDSATGQRGRELLAVLARAATPAERIAGGWLRPTGETPLAEERLERWSHRVGGGQPERVAEVLAELGVSLDQWRIGLSDVTAVPGEPLPTWAQDAMTLLNLVGTEWEWPDPPRLREVAGDELPDWVDPDQPWRFYPGFRDWMAAARRDVDTWAASAPITEEAKHDLVLNLAQRQLTASGPLLMATVPGRPVDDPLFEGDARSDWEALWSTHPVVSRLLATAWRQWRETTEELCSRVGADLPSVSPGVAVTRIELAAGDQHCDGRGVARLRLSDGTSAFLKPRADGLHRLLGAVLAQVDSAGTPLGLRLPDLSERDGYSWAGEVVRGDCPEERGVDSYFRRAGALVRVTQAMGSTDLHHENFVAAPDLPVLVDFETVVAPGALRTARPDDALSARLTDTPGSSSMITSVVSGPPGRNTADIGALAGPREMLTPYTVRTLVLEKDGPALRSARAPLPNGTALPTRDGVRVSLRGHEQALIDGYADVQRRLASLAHTEHVPALHPEPAVRLLARATRLYAQVLGSSLAPDALVDGVERELVLQGLYKATGTAPRGLIGCEVDALRELDIPMFTVPFTRTDLVSDRGVILPDAIREAPAAKIRARLREAADRDDYVDDLRATLFSMDPDEPPSESEDDRGDPPPTSVVSGAPARSGRAREQTRFSSASEGGRPSLEARSVREPDNTEPVALLLDRVIELDDGAVAWIGLEHDPNRNRWTYGRMSAGLTGQAGIGLALATVAARAADPPAGSAAVARAAVLGSVARVGLGNRGPADAFGGPAGVLYAAAVVARLLDDAVLLDAARSLVAPCLSAARRAEPSIVIDGTAGAILALLQLPEDPAVADTLTELAELADLPPIDADVDAADSWSASLPSRTYGTALARCRLAQIRPERVSLPDLPTPTGPGDAIAAATIRHPVDLDEPAMVDASLRVLLDQAELAGAALRRGANGGWAERRDRLIEMLLTRRAATGRWCAPLLAPDPTLLSPIHGIAALATLCTDVGRDVPSIRTLT